MLQNILRKLRGRNIINIIGIVFLIASSNAYSQTPKILSPNNAVVTGFSGTVKNVKHESEHFINLEGPTVRILNLPMGSYGLNEEQGQFSFKAKEVGQVFGVALDDKPSPNIYVAATSVYGLAIYKTKEGRLQNGESGAQYVPGLFGPVEQGAGATSIWRINPETGEVSLFTNVVYNGIENSPASLGGLAFDPRSQKLFVADRATGMIHSYGADGKEFGVYDHGVKALSAVGKSPVPFDASHVVTIEDPKFDVKNPDTWGYAPIERRVFALAIYKKRLYYSVSKSQIWSVGIKNDGSFAEDPRLEIESSTLRENNEISAIAFDKSGYMYIAERGFPIGDYDFTNVAKNDETRVLRFSPKTNNPTGPFWTTPGEEYAIGMQPAYQNADGGVDIGCGEIVWSTSSKLTNGTEGIQGNEVQLVKPENMPPEKSWLVKYYDKEDFSSRGNVGAITIWKKCEGIALPSSLGQPKTSLSTTPSIQCQNGFCLSPPPICSHCCFWPCSGGMWGWGCPWLNPWINPWAGPWGWGGLEGPLVMVDPVFGGIGGPLIIVDPVMGLGGWGPGAGPWGWGIWGVGPFGPWGWGGFWGVGPWGIDPWFNPWFDPWLNPWGPWGWGGPWGGCGIWPCLFDPGFLAGPCLLPLDFCPGFLVGDHCFAPIWPIAIIEKQLEKQTAPISACKPNERLVHGKCVPRETCKPNERLVNGQCVTIIECRPNERLIHGRCEPTIVCKANERLVDGQCVSIIKCKPNERLVRGRCEPFLCDSNERLVDGICIPDITCKSNERLVNGKCVPNILCRESERLVNGKCIPNCKSNERFVNGKCIPEIICKPNERLVYGRCIPEVICKKGERLVNGRCIPDVVCKPNERLVHGRCVPIVTCKPYERLVNGKCVPNVTCQSGERLVNGKCVPICRSYERLINGRCVPVTQCGPNERMVNGRCVPNIGNTNTRPNTINTNTIKPDNTKTNVIKMNLQN